MISARITCNAFRCSVAFAPRSAEGCGAIATVMSIRNLSMATPANRLAVNRGS